MKRLLTALLITAFTAQAFAIDLASAKTKGLIGERNDGYLGYVVKPASAEVKALVKSVNNKRRDKFRQTVGKTGATLDQVAKRFAQRAYEKTSKGNYIQAANGQWIKK
ncbi:YdbL family protein [Pseudoteredinibacter isoporae]|uniref:YdbL family protein n=1 Tax=Pseudoteredinibacter isoporae TaxID=570281 RepID=UPI0031076B4E